MWFRSTISIKLLLNVTNHTQNQFEIRIYSGILFNFAEYAQIKSGKKMENQFHFCIQIFIKFQLKQFIRYSVH